jgi:hypothetical protein
MYRWPFILSQAVSTGFGVAVAMFLLRKPAEEIIQVVFVSSILAAFAAICLLRWKRLRIGTSVAEYHRR